MILFTKINICNNLRRKIKYMVVNKTKDQPHKHRTYKVFKSIRIWRIKVLIRIWKWFLRWRFECKLNLNSTHQPGLKVCYKFIQIIVGKVWIWLLSTQILDKNKRTLMVSGKMGNNVKSIMKA